MLHMHCTLRLMYCRQVMHNHRHSNSLGMIHYCHSRSIQAIRHCCKLGPGKWRNLLLGLQMRKKHHCREEPRHKAANMGQVRGPRGRGGHRDDEVYQECNHHDAPQDGPAGGTLAESARLHASKAHTPMYQGQIRAWHPGLCTKEYCASCACCPLAAKGAQPPGCMLEAITHLDYRWAL